MKAKEKPRAIILSKRANVFYLEHARVLQKDDRVLYLTDTGEEVERFFNIPERNTALLLLGKGTSITDAAARKLADAGVMVGFCGSGGSPLLSAVDPVFMPAQSEYRPTEYMQAWMRSWLDDEKRLTAAKKLLLRRIEWVIDAWDGNNEIAKRNIFIDDQACRKFESDIHRAKDTEALLQAEAAWAKTLYKILADGYGLKDFSRKAGERGGDLKEDFINGMLDHGNYIAYGYAAVALHGLGISFSLPALHGKTRRGALVFDVADLFKDAVVMPLAFEFGVLRKKDTEFRSEMIRRCQVHNILDRLFDDIKLILCDKV